MSAPRRTFLLVGASRGIGAAAAAHLVGQGATVLGVSRTPAAAGEWIEADVAESAGLERIAASVGERSLDALLYLGGTWEADAFTDAFAFAASPPQETRDVIAVNLIAPILLAQRLAANLAAAPNPRIILNGALSGRPNGATAEVANTASKFGLQGAAEALTIALKPHGIGVSVVNPGNVGTSEVEDDIASGRFASQTPIPISDVLAAYDFILNLSPATTPTTIDLAQTRP